MIKIEDDKDFYSFIAQRKPVLVVFSTHECATCIPVEKKIDERFDGVEKRKAYLDDLAKLRGELSIFNVPVVSIYFESKEFARFVRVFSINDVEKKLNRLMEFV